MYEEINFCSLADDCQINVIKYLTIKERVRLERINKKFRELLDNRWVAQKVLVAVGPFVRTTLYTPFYTGNVCSNKWHKFGSDKDVFIDKNSSFLENAGKIIKRCQNLKAIYWQGSCPSALGELINSNCHELEHISMDSGFEDIDGLTTVVPERLQCILMENGYSGNADKPFAEFLEKCSSLTRFRVHELVDTSPQVTEVALKKHFLELDTGIVWVPKEIDALFPYLVSHGAQLLRLRIDHVLDTEKLQILCKNLKNLETIDVRTDTSDMSPLKDLSKLQEIVWETYHNTYCGDFRFLAKVFNSNRHVKSISLFTPDIGLNLLGPMLVDHCPFLESLIVTVDRRPAPVFDPNFMKGLKKLRRLRLQFMGLKTDEILTNVFESCSKLNYISLIGRRFRITNDIVSTVVGYANRHPKRAISLEIMEHRIDLKSPVTLLPSNLRIIDDQSQDIKLSSLSV